VRPRVQVVVAHPDDETFGCGSLLLHAAAMGAVTAVCCATRGEAGEVKGGGTDIGPAELAVLRERELHAAAELLGVDRVDLLGFTDSGMGGSASPQTLWGAPLALVVDAVREQVAAFQPDVLITLDASDGHRDHARIRDASVAAARAVGVPRVYLQCLPRSLMRRWIETMRTDRPDMEHLDADVAALGTPDDEITTVIDTSEFLAARERAIAAHATQTSPFDGLPDDLRRAFLGTDHALRVVPPWTGGPLETHLLTGVDPTRRQGHG